METKLKTAVGSLDYIFDWAPLRNGRGTSDWLQPGEQISLYDVTAESGIAIDQVELINTASAVRVWVSSGTAGLAYKIKCEITTNSVPNRVDSREFLLKIVP